MILRGDPEPLFAVRGKAALQVCVTEEVDSRRGHVERGPGISHGQHIMVLIEKRAVSTTYHGSIGHDRSCRHVAEPIRMLGGENAAGPACSPACDGIKTLYAFDPAACFVVVAAHKYVALLPGAVNDLVWIGPVTNHISEVPDGVVGRGGSQNSVQSIEVGVNVREDENTHQKAEGRNWP